MVSFCHRNGNAMQAVIAKNERITARISEDVKQLLTKAAELSGATLNRRPNPSPPGKGFQPHRLAPQWLTPWPQPLADPPAPRRTSVPPMAN